MHHMESSQSKVVRGRGRGRNVSKQQDPPPPSITTTESTIPSSIETEITHSTLSENINNQLAERFAISNTVSSTASSLDISRIRLHQSDELGTLGERIQVMVNYFPVLQYPQQGFVYRYYIQIWNKKSQVIRRNHRRLIYNCWLTEFCRKYPQIDRDRIVFDNQTAVFTYNQGLTDVNEIEIMEKIMAPNRANRLEEYQVSIKQAGNPIDLSLLRSIKKIYGTDSDHNIHINDLHYIRQMLSIVLHEHCSSQADYIYNRTFFKQPVLQNKYGHWDLGLGKAAWRGFYSCLVFANGSHQLLMNLDVSHAIFMKKQPFVDFLCEIMLHSPCGRREYGRDHKVRKVEISDAVRYLDKNIIGTYYEGEIEFLFKQCKNLRVRFLDANLTRINEICGLGETALTQTFKWKWKGKEITVANYYNEQYGKQLEYPSLPILRMRNQYVVPMEVLEVEPVKVKNLTDEQRALFSRCSLLNPSECYQSIKEIHNDSKQQHFEKTRIAAAWNFKIDANMHKTPARILPMPDIIYTGRYRVTREHCRSLGVWNNVKTQFHHPTPFPSVWAMINLSSSLNRESCETFYNELSTAAGELGISCPPPLIYEEYKVQAQSINRMIVALKQMMEQNDDCKFFIVILPEDTTIVDRIYGELKKLCELESGFGIVTQMIKATTIKAQRGNNDQCNYSTLNNILLKINTKLNGINSILHVPDVIERFFKRGHGIMYVGVDLSHSPSGSNDQRSIVAVVASADDIPNRYFKEIYIQNRFSSDRNESVESVVKMKEIMKSLVSQYEQHRGCPPKAIVIYRDGIADSVFDTVFKKELMAIREACVELCPVYQPCLTYIVVNKGHHTRFFPTNLKGNIVAGTVIDSHDVTYPATYNFFLTSHHWPSGTSRPTHYHVLYDDNKLKPNEMQMLTYALCYTYARCTRSISIPAPLKYAHLLAHRTKFYLAQNNPFETNLTTLQSTGKADGHQTNLSTQIRLSPKLAPDALFFL